jgi:hypothetical protein
VQPGGPYSNADAQTYAGNTGYMPRKTVGGLFGRQVGERVANNPMARQGYGVSPGTGADPNLSLAENLANDPVAQNRSGVFFGGATIGVGADGRPTFFAAKKPGEGEVGGRATQEYLDERFGPGKYRLGPRGEIIGQPRSPGVLTGYQPGVGNVAAPPPRAPYTGPSPLEAQQATRNAAVADAMSGEPQTQRGLLTARAMQETQARRGRIEARRAGPQQPGLLEQMALRDPRMAMQVADLQQRGLLAQLAMQQQGQDRGLRRELGLLEAGNQREANQARLAQYGSQDALKYAEAGANARKIAMEYEGRRDFVNARKYHAQADEFERRIGGRQDLFGPTGGQQPTGAPAVPPAAASANITDPAQWRSLVESTPEEQERTLIGLGVTDPRKRAAIRTEASGGHRRGVLDMYADFIGQGLKGSGCQCHWLCRDTFVAPFVPTPNAARYANQRITPG